MGYRGIFGQTLMWLLIFVVCYMFQLFTFPELSVCFSEDIVVATVNNDITIRKSELDDVIAEYKEKTRKKEITKEAKISLVKNLIRRQLILQQESIRELRNDPELIERVKGYEDGLVIKRFLDHRIGSQLKVNEQEIKGYYDANRQKFSLPPKVEAYHILLRSQKEAEQVLVKLRGGREDFTQMAKDYSIDLPMALEGGKMGIIEKGKTLPELEKVLFTLKEGEVSDIVKTRFGYHILKVDQIMPPDFKPFEAVKKEIEVTILRQKEREAFEQLVTQMEQGAEIKILEDRLN